MLLGRVIGFGLKYLLDGNISVSLLEVAALEKHGQGTHADGGGHTHTHTHTHTL